MLSVSKLFVFDDIAGAVQCSIKNNPKFDEFILSNTKKFREMFNELSCEESATMTRKFDQYKIEWKFINCIVRVFLINGTNNEVVKFLVHIDNI